MNIVFPKSIGRLPWTVIFVEVNVINIVSLAIIGLLAYVYNFFLWNILSPATYFIN